MRPAHKAGGITVNVFLTQLRRRAVLFSLLAILLAAVIAFLSIGFSALTAVRRQIRGVSGQYTTIAVPVEGSPWRFAFSQEDSTAPVPLLQQTPRLPGLLAEDRRALLNAHVKGCTSVSAYEKDEFSNYSYDFFSRDLAVLAVRCTEVLELEGTQSRLLLDETGGIAGSEECVSRDMLAEFSLESVLCLFPAYADILPPIETVHFAGPYPSDSRLPFEKGKTYLLFGCIHPDGNLTMTTDENGEQTFEYSTPGLWYLRPTIPVSASHINTQPGAMRIEGFLRSLAYLQGADGVFSWCVEEDSLPYCAEYTGDVEAFLRSDAGALWRDTIIPMCRTNYESANLILTDNSESILWFNNDNASIFEGRGLESADYANGSNVCLVSAAYALKNGLSVGDSIELDLYQAQMGTTPGIEGNIFGVPVTFNVYEPCKEENRLNIKKDYKIVGIYAAPEFASGEHSFSANAIFAPKSSVPNAALYEDIRCTPLYSAILENGGSDTFEAALEARGHGELFAYFDQNYNMLAETLDVMHANAMRMTLISSALFVLVTALFFFLFLRQTADPARKLRLLGLQAGIVRRQRYGASIVLIVSAAALGAAAAAGLYGAVTRRVLSGSIALQPSVLLLSVAAQTVLLLAAALLCTLATSRQNLMQKK